MGIFDFFKKKKVEEVEVEKVSFEEVEGWVDKKKQKIEKKEKEIFIEVKKAIEDFVVEFNVKLDVLKNFDIDKKKAEERIKVLVVENLNKYISYVNIFIQELESLEDCCLGDLIKKINKTFSDFKKASHVFYERATYLIGDEIGNVKKDIIKFSEYFTKLFEKNQNLLNELKIINSIKLKLKEINEIDKTLSKINEDLKSLDKNIINSKEKEKKVLHEIEKVKASKDYEENLKNQEEIKLTEKQLDDDVLKLQTLVDFKALSNVFHSDEKKMKIIKNYKEYFKENIAKDNGESILNLISEAKLNSNIIADKIKQFNEKKQKIAEDKKHIKQDETKTLEEESQKTKSEIENLIIDKVKHLRRGEAIEVSKKEIVEKIKEDVEHLGGQVVGDYKS